LSYRARLHPKVSNAEIELFKALSMAGLTGGMVTQKTIVLKATIPDFCWPEKRKIVYLGFFRGGFSMLMPPPATDVVGGTSSGPPKPLS
jgi:hypothetical protein